MGNLSEYKKAWGDGRDAMRHAYSDYKKTVDGLEKHKGSAWGDEQLANAKAKYDADLRAARSRFGERMDKVLESMKSALDKREKEQAAKVPSDEQLRMLQAVQLRSSLTVSEFQLYSDMMRDCEVASKALHDLAVERMPEGTNLEPKRTLRGLAWEQAKQLSREAKNLARWDGCTARGDALTAHLAEVRENGHSRQLSLNNVPTETSKAFNAATAAGEDPTSPDFYKHALGIMLFDEKALELLD